MGANIKVLIGGQKKGITNDATAAVVHTELMRERILTYSITKDNSIRQFAIDPDAQFIADGQTYDNVGYDETSGSDNISTFKAYHVLLRTKNYTVPANYAFVGTKQAILRDILDVSGASNEFSVGSCDDTNTYSYSLGNTQPTDVYTAIAMMTKIGCEPYYDNFTINLPVRWGADRGNSFEFGRNLCSLKRHFDKTTTPWTWAYETDIANLQRIPGHEGDIFEIGDTEGIKDSYRGDEIVGERITVYDKCLDDPTQDKVSIGAFIPDLCDTVSAMQVDITKAQSKADNSVQIGVSYNNVKTTHEKGFESDSGDGLSQIFMNGTDGEVRQQYYNGKWVIVYQANKGADGAGEATYYNLDHSQKVVIGGSYGFTTWKSTDGGQTWTQTGGQDVDGNISANKLTSPNDDTVHGEIGNLGSSYGFRLMNKGEVDGWFGVYELVGGGFAIYYKNQRLLDGDENGISTYKNGQLDGISASYPLGPWTLSFYNGRLNSSSGDGSVITATVDLGNGHSLTFTKGMLTGAS